MSSNKLEKSLLTDEEVEHLNRSLNAVLISDSKGFTLRNNFYIQYGETYPIKLWCESGGKTIYIYDIPHI